MSLMETSCNLQGGNNNMALEKEFEVLEAIEVGKKLKEFRLKEGLILDDLSEIMEVSQGSISDLENGKSYPSYSTISRYRHFFPNAKWNKILF